MSDRDEAVTLPAEDKLVRAAQRGDRAAFAGLVERYWDRLYRWLYHLTHDPHTAEDLAQETFLKAFAGLGRFRPDSNFQAWLFRIGHNNFVNQRRAASRLRQAVPDHLPDGGAGPAEQAQHLEAEQLLARAVGRLPADFRTAFLLRVDEGLPFRRVAAILGITEETARWRVFKARQKLLNVLAPELDRENQP